MAVWNLFWLILLIVVIYLVVRKIRKEAKVKNGRTQLAGKVRERQRRPRRHSTDCQELVFICVWMR